MDDTSFITSLLLSSSIWLNCSFLEQLRKEKNTNKNNNCLKEISLFKKEEE
jgi:hypothetical protein